MRSRKRIDPVKDLYRSLQTCEMPGRYVGGEWGSIRREEDDLFRIALTFPELYEVGMSNTAIKILYGILNSLSGVACERVFVPAPDFEASLSQQGIPLYTLETGTPVGDTDLLAVSYGYELLATNVLTILSSSGIPIRSVDRTEKDPIVILGGPGATNPKPMAPFVDGIFVGEAEELLPQIVSEMAELRRRGASRNDLLETLRSERSVWYSGRVTPAVRAIWNGFGSPEHRRQNSFGVGFPVPSIPVVQDHGVAEIMRGCPQGCRFCHAGMYYRPYRMKSIDLIRDEVRWLVESLGYREISLSSLSTGDYGDIVSLIDVLSREFHCKGVSFSLPSLRVNSITLPILEAVSRGKRSGLTFAVESADEASQAAVNKAVPLERVIEIAAEARRRGWRHAKLYFMIGLPVPERDSSHLRIAEYVTALRRAVPLEYIVNVGTFVPKPHTPFQWAPQIDPDSARLQLDELRTLLPRGTKLRSHDPRQSWLEGILTRGDLVIAEMIERAHIQGARLDAWDEHTRLDIWQGLAEEVQFRDAVLRSNGPFQTTIALPWDEINLGVSKRSLIEEERRSRAEVYTNGCTDDCDHPCGVCNKTVNVRVLDSNTGKQILPVEPQKLITEDTTGGSEKHGRDYQLVVRYKKEGRAAFLPHLAMVRTFERIWHRIGVEVALTQGYHPKPKMSFGQPLPLGTGSRDELVLLNVQNNIHIDKLYHEMNAAMPEGMVAYGMILLHHEKGSPRIPSPMQQYGGSFYLISTREGYSVRQALSDILWASEGAAETLGDNLIFLSSASPGFGKILKSVPDRALIEATRLRMVSDGPERQDLFDFYVNLSNCVAVIPTDAGESAASAIASGQAVVSEALFS